MFKYGVLITAVLYAVDIFLNLRFAEERNPRGYVVTKTLLMPLLLTVYFFTIPADVRQNFSQINMVMALFFHWIGDVLLLFPRNKTKRYFFGGMISFFIGHLFYSMWFLKTDIGHSKLAVVIILPILVLLEFILYGQVSEGSRELTLVLMFYSLGLFLLACSVVSTMGNATNVLASLVSLLGVFLFIISDYNIARRTVKKPLFGQVFTQSTYIAAQTLIVTGIALLQYFNY